MFENKDMATQSKVKTGVEENILNIKETQEYKKIVASSNSLFKKAQSTLDIAQYNASKIIYDAVEMAYETKTSIIRLLSDIKNNQNNIDNIFLIVENFVKQNEEIYIADKSKLEISEELTNKIVKKINNN